MLRSSVFGNRSSVIGLSPSVLVNPPPAPPGRGIKYIGMRYPVFGVTDYRLLVTDYPVCGHRSFVRYKSINYDSGIKEIFNFASEN
jgi:hypothetical protein